MVCYDTTNQAAPPIPSMGFRVRTTDTTVESTLAYQSAVGIPTKIIDAEIPDTRVVAGDSAASAVHYRMTIRGDSDQMPPQANGYTDFIDPAGIAAIDAWISDL